MIRRKTWYLLEKIVDPTSGHNNNDDDVDDVDDVDDDEKKKPILYPFLTIKV